MSCDDEKDILDEEEQNYKDAQNEYNDAKTGLAWNQWQFDTANLNLTNCDGLCSDELGKFEAAAGDLGAAERAFFEADAALDEAGGWFDIASGMYCDCKNSEDDGG